MHNLRYWLLERWRFHVQFNNQDAWMVELMPESGPERLYRPDASITGWRRLCDNARGESDLAETAPEETALEDETPADLARI
jgi:hypothetical protein